MLHQFFGIGLYTRMLYLCLDFLNKRRDTKHNVVRTNLISCIAWGSRLRKEVKYRTWLEEAPFNHIFNKWVISVDITCI